MPDAGRAVTEAPGAPLVSVVLPTYNRGTLLARSALSVLEQSYQDLELIIVDDGSIDETASVISSLLRFDNRVRSLAHETNCGANAARNKGIAHSRGSLIAFQDSDDIWAPDKLQRQVTTILREGAKVCFCALKKETPRGWQVIPKPAYGIKPGLEHREKEVLEGSFVSCQTLVIERELLMALGGFDTNLPRLQDWELAIRLSRRAPLYYIPEILVSVTTRSDSISGNPALLADAVEKIVMKHQSAFRAHKLAAGILFVNSGLALLRWHETTGFRFLLRGLRLASFRTPSVLGLLLRRSRTPHVGVLQSPGERSRNFNA